jgi:hypothetical protein
MVESRVRSDSGKSLRFSVRGRREAKSRAVTLSFTTRPSTVRQMFHGDSCRAGDDVAG